MEALLLCGMVLVICLACIIENTVHQLKERLEIRMTELADAVAALTEGVNAHGAAQAKALAGIQADFDAAISGGAGAAEAAQRVRANIASLAESTSTLENLDLDPSNPVIPPPPEPTPEPAPAPTPPPMPPPAPEPAPAPPVEPPPA